MSNNSVIYLFYSPFKSRGYAVQHRDIEAPDNVYYSKSSYKTLLSALKKAKEIQDTQNPEYGIHILSLEENK